MGEAKVKAATVANGSHRSCGNCQYFRRIEPKHPGGVCRARPPIPVMVGMAKHPVSGQPVAVINTYWPEIPDVEWCGAHELRADIALQSIDLSRLDTTDVSGSA